MKAMVPYSDELAVRICTRRAAAEPLTKICQDDDFPDVTTVYSWIRERADFRAIYSIAQEDMANTLGDQMLTIADDAPLVVEVEGQKVEVKLDMAAVQRNRLRLDTRKWLASKMFPRKFGDTLAIGGAQDLPPLQMDDMSTIESARRIAFTLSLAENILDKQRANAPPLLTYSPKVITRD